MGGDGASRVAAVRGRVAEQSDAHEHRRAEAHRRDEPGFDHTGLHPDGEPGTLEFSGGQREVGAVLCHGVLHSAQGDNHDVEARAGDSEGHHDGAPTDPVGAEADRLDDHDPADQQAELLPLLRFLDLSLSSWWRVAEVPSCGPNVESTRVEDGPAPSRVEGHRRPWAEPLSELARSSNSGGGAEDQWWTSRSRHRWTASGDHLP